LSILDELVRTAVGEAAPARMILFIANNGHYRTRVLTARASRINEELGITQQAPLWRPLDNSAQTLNSY
jgi:hypothetical protein